MKQIKLKLEKCRGCMFCVRTKLRYYCYNVDEKTKGRVIPNPDVIDADCILDDWQGDE